MVGGFGFCVFGFGFIIAVVWIAVDVLLSLFVGG